MLRCLQNELLAEAAARSKIKTAIPEPLKSCHPLRYEYHTSLKLTVSRMSPTPSHEQKDGPERSIEIELPSEVWAVVFECESAFFFGLCLLLHLVIVVIAITINFIMLSTLFPWLYNDFNCVRRHSLQEHFVLCCDMPSIST